MSKNVSPYSTAVIRNLLELKDDYEIKPATYGFQNSVFIVTTPKRTRVCKFNRKHLAYKNMMAALVYNENNIPVPDVKMLSNNDGTIEVYDMIPGQTLFEAIKDGMTTEQLRNVYYELVHYFALMDKLDTYPLDRMEYGQAHNVAYANIADTVNKPMALLYSTFVRLMNLGNSMDNGMYHWGMTPKNIILNNDGHVCGLIDMDEVTICNKNFAFARMSAKYRGLGMNHKELIDHYTETTKHTLNSSYIDNISALNNFGQTVLWKMTHIRKTK